MNKGKPNKIDIILAIDSTVGKSSLTITNCGEIIASVVDKANEISSVTLLCLIDELLNSANLCIKDVDLFASTNGPGSYTGLRVGLSTIKAIAYSLDKPCVGVPTLKALAHVAGSSDFTLSLLPAGREEVFVQPFKVDCNQYVKELSEAKCLEVNKLLEEMAGVRNVILIGLGAELLEVDIMNCANKAGIKVFSSTVSKLDKVSEDFEGWVLVNSDIILSESVAALAAEEYLKEKAHTPYNLKAVYVRAL